MQNKVSPATEENLTLVPELAASPSETDGLHGLVALV